MLLLKATAFLLACCSLAAAAPAVCITSVVVPTGELCTIRPSNTYPGMIDQSASQFGFGDHVIGLPTTSNNKLWVNIGGSSGKPFLPATGQYQHKAWLTEIMGKGYTVIDLAYDNEVSVTTSCQGVALNNCAGNIRKEVLLGVDSSTLRNVNSINSFQHRLKALIDYLKANNVPLPSHTYPFINWRHMTVSGHSQGAGLAFYIAKFYGVSFSCLLGGPYDVPDGLPPQEIPIADWYLEPVMGTDVSNIGAFLTVDDDNYVAFTVTYNVIIGLVKDESWFDADKVTYYDDLGNVVNGHAASIQDPSLSAGRAAACFR